MNEANIPVATPVNEPKPVQAPPASARAMATLILGILSLICAGFLSGVPAIIIGSMELKSIRAGLSPKSGEGVAKVGYILGIVGTVLSCLALFFIVGLAALGISLSNSGAFNNITSSV